MNTMMSINRWLHKHTSSLIMLKSGSVLDLHCIRYCERRKEDRNIHVWQMSACTHAPVRRMSAPCAIWTERRCVAEAGEKCPMLPGGSWTITHPLTRWPTPTQFKSANTFTETQTTWLLTFLRCSEVNSLNCLNKPVQLAVVNLQLKNMIFGRIASFSHIAAGGCRKMKVFIAATVNLFKWSQLQPFKKAEHLNFRSPKWQSSTLWLKSKTNGSWWLGRSCSLNLHRCFWSWRSSSCTSDDKKMKRLHIRTWWLMQTDVLSRYVTVAVKSLWTALFVWATT